MIETLFRKIQVQSRFQIVNNAVAVLHDGRRNLDASRSHEDKFKRVFPCLNATHGAQVHIGERRIVSHLRDKAQRDRLHGISAVSAHRGHPMHGRGRNVGVGVDPDDTLDRVDSCNAIGAASHSRFCGGAHAVHVGSEFCQDRNPGSPSCGSRKPLHKLWHLSDIRTEPALSHIRAGEIQFDRIGAVLLAQPRQSLPVLIILPHYGGQNEFARVILLEPAEDLHVLLYAVIRELLNILKPDDTAVVTGDCGKARRSLVDLHGADRLKGSACPARFKGPRAHIIGAGHYGR